MTDLWYGWEIGPKTNERRLCLRVLSSVILRYGFLSVLLKEDWVMFDINNRRMGDLPASKLEYPDFYI